MRPRLLAAALCVLLTIVAATPALAHDDRGPALRFQETELTTSLDELHNGVRLRINNDRARPLTARIRISDLGLKAPGTPPAALPTAEVVKFPFELDVAAAATQTLEIKAPANVQVVAGVYRGQLSVFEPETDSVARIPVVLSVGQPELVTPKPAVEKLTIRAVRWVPWGDDAVDVRDQYLPLKAPGDTSADKLDLAKSKLLGLLPGDQRRVVEVTYEGKTKRLSPNVAAAELGLLNAGRPGEYKGKIDTLPDAAGGEVEITVVTTDSIWIALVPLLLGIGLALWQRHYKGAGRPGLVLAGQEARLGSEYREARAAYKTAAAGKPWATYDTQADFLNEAKLLREDLAQLARTSFDELDEEARGAIEKRIEKLEAHVGALPGLAADLEALDTALDAVEKLGPIESLQGEDSPASPAFVADARGLLQGRALKLAEFDALSKKVAAASSLATRWPQMHAEASRAAERLAPYERRRSELDDEERRLVLQASTSLKGVWVQLWETESAQVVVDRKLAETLVSALSTVAQLTAIRLPKRRATLGGKAAPEGVTAEEPLDERAFDSILPVLGRELAQAPRDPERRAERIAAAIRRGDLLQIVLAGSIALFTGLQALYIGKVFGDTPLDYLTALLWGITTAGAVDLLAEALRSRLDGVLPGR